MAKQKSQETPIVGIYANGYIITITALHVDNNPQFLEINVTKKPSPAGLDNTFFFFLRKWIR